MITREEYLSRIFQKIGKPYIWGCMGPDAFDCSGLVCYGLELEAKNNALELAMMFDRYVVDRKQAPPGSLYFYGKPGIISHVMTVASHWPNGGITLIGARGGDSTTTTLDIAMQQKAFVDCCWETYWFDAFQFAVDPFKG